MVPGRILQNEIKVYINCTQWTSMICKNPGKIKVTGGAFLKAVVPIGVTKVLRFVNPNGGEATTTWGW